MLPTITIASTRLVSTLDMEVLLGGLIAVAAIAWMMTSHLRHHHRHR